MTQQPEIRGRNLEQERGRQAWEDINAIKQQSKEFQKEYRSLARGLNALIQSNGLGQTLGFLNAKGKKDPHRACTVLLAHLTAWMRVPGHFNASNQAIMETGPDGLLRWIIDVDTSSTDYRRATAECLAFGLWLRRFAEAELTALDMGEA